MILDAVEDVSETGLRIKAFQFGCLNAIQLGCLNDRHCACECFRTGISPGKQPVLSFNADRARGGFSRIIVDCHTTVCQEQAEDLLAIEAIAKRLGEVALARNAQELLPVSGKEGHNLRQAMLLTCRVTDISRLAARHCA